jgi:hypothetical protein
MITTPEKKKYVPHTTSPWNYKFLAVTISSILENKSGNAHTLSNILFKNCASRTE